MGDMHAGPAGLSDGRGSEEEELYRLTEEARAEQERFDDEAERDFADRMEDEEIALAVNAGDSSDNPMYISSSPYTENDDDEDTLPPPVELREHGTVPTNRSAQSGDADDALLPPVQLRTLGSKPVKKAASSGIASGGGESWAAGDKRSRNDRSYKEKTDEEIEKEFMEWQYQQDNDDYEPSGKHPKHTPSHDDTDDSYDEDTDNEFEDDSGDGPATAAAPAATTPADEGNANFPLVVIPSMDMPRFPDAFSMFKTLHTKDGPIIGCALIHCAETTTGVSPADLLRYHTESMSHQLLPEYHYGGAKYERVPGFGQIQRNCTLHTLKASFPMYDVMLKSGIKISPHIERAWVQKSRRCFQGVSKKRPVPFQSFRYLKADEIKALDPCLYVLPLQTEMPGGNILMAYSGDMHTGMSRPHGIANKTIAKPCKWHVEPGGDTVVYVSRNDEHESTGYYLKVNRSRTEITFKKRLNYFKRGVYMPIHDPTLLSWVCAKNISLTLSNYVCASCNALPLVWEGNDLSDPLGIAKNGAANNRPKYVDGVKVVFRLQQGHFDIRDTLHQWPKGIEVPDALLEWATRRRADPDDPNSPTIGFKPLDNLSVLATKYPHVFVAYFPEFKAKDFDKWHKL